MKQKEFLTIRPSLAARLMEKGFRSIRTVNPWDEKKTAWKFTLSRELASAVIEYYEEIGTPAPQSVIEYFNRFNSHSV